MLRLKQILLLKRTAFKFYVLLSLSFIVTNILGNKFMIKNGDTLPYQLELSVSGTDTFYLGACHTFEYFNGQIINQSDKNCLRQGHWIITDSLGNYWMGEYEDNWEKGIWKQFNRNNQLLMETKNVHLGKNNYLVKKIIYTKNIPTILVDKKFLAFYIENFFILVSIIFGSLFGRFFINSRIYNIENNTNYFPIYFYMPGYVSENFHHSMLCMFSFWFSNYKPENKTLVKISNILSVIGLSTFGAIMVGLAISGEL